MKEKLKNPWFIIGMFAVVFISAGIEVESLTSWPLLINSLLGIVSNPFCLLCVVIAMLSVWNDNGSAGLDGADKIKDIFKIK